MVSIKGWQKTSLIDFAPNTSSVVFLAGCSFNCRFCHNPSLVLNANSLPDISEKEVLDYLSEKKMWIDGVCITGGEPTLHADLPGFISKIKEKGMLVKLDTNGTNPKMLKELIDNDMVDFIAMDIKAPIDRYDEVAGIKVDKEKIKESVELIRNSGVDYEFRTTVVPGLVGKKEVFLIGKWLKGCKKYAIQNFRQSRQMIDRNLMARKPYTKEELKEIKEVVQEYFDEIEIRD